LLPEPPDREILTLLEAAALLRIGETTLRASVKAGTIPHTRYGKRILFKRSLLLGLMDQEAS
jgi:excisionase family DNA binding protein